MLLYFVYFCRLLHCNVKFVLCCTVVLCIVKSNLYCMSAIYCIIISNIGVVLYYAYVYHLLYCNVKCVLCCIVCMSSVYCIQCIVMSNLCCVVLCVWLLSEDGITCIDPVVSHHGGTQRRETSWSMWGLLGDCNLYH